jgi:hypothetical protein
MHIIYQCIKLIFSSIYFQTELLAYSILSDPEPPILKVQDPDQSKLERIRKHWFNRYRYRGFNSGLKEGELPDALGEPREEGEPGDEAEAVEQVLGPAHCLSAASTSSASPLQRLGLSRN